MQHHKRLRTPAAATYLGIAKTTLEKLRSLNQGPSYIKLGRAVVYDTTDLDLWLEKNRKQTGEGNNHV